MTDACRVDWDSFDLAPPDDLDGPGLAWPCTRPAEYQITQACVHEHVSVGLVCGPHLDMMRGLHPLGQWHCGRCLRAESPHPCIAPVVAVRLSAAARHG